MNTNEINKLYELALRDFYNLDYQQYKRYIAEYKIKERAKARPKSKNYFNVFKEPLKPYFISLAQRNELARLTEVMVNIFEKLTNLYCQNKDINKILSVKGKVKDYIDINPGYSRKLLVTRLDALIDFSKNTYRFIEINCDIPGGMGINNLLTGIYNKVPSMEFIRKKFRVENDVSEDIFCNMIIERYKEYCLRFLKKEQKDPNIAVVCARNSVVRLKLDILTQFLRKKDLQVTYADPRDFVYDGNTLKLNGKEIHIVYRRENIRDIFRTESTGKLHSNVRNSILNYSKAACLKNRFVNRCLKRGYFGHTEDLIKAYADNNICMINPFHSSICVQKSAFALIQDKRFNHLFSDEELFVINNYIPWTRILENTKTSWEDKEIDLVPFVKNNRLNFVLKPNMGFGGKGVIIGSEVNQMDWEKKIDLIIKSGPKYVVQQYVELPIENFPVYKNEILTGFSPKYVNISFWGIDGKYAGGFIRISDEKVVNVAKGGKLLPVFYVSN